MSKNILSYSFQNFSAVLGKVLTSSSVFLQCSRNWQMILKKNWGTSYRSFQGIWVPLKWPFNCKIICIRFQYWLTKIGTSLFVKSQAKNQNKFSIQLMGRNFIQSSPGINFRTSFIEHLFMWFIFHYGWHWFSKLCRLQHVTYYRKWYREYYFQIAKFVKNTFSIVYG